jgi:hypothetical protein
LAGYAWRYPARLRRTLEESLEAEVLENWEKALFGEFFQSYFLSILAFFNPTSSAIQSHFLSDSFLLPQHFGLFCPVFGVVRVSRQGR